MLRPVRQTVIIRTWRASIYGSLSGIYVLLGRENALVCIHFRDRTAVRNLQKSGSHMTLPTPLKGQFIFRCVYTEALFPQRRKYGQIWGLPVSPPDVVGKPR